MLRKCIQRFFKSSLNQTLYIKLSDTNINTNLLQIKIQPMEQYSILHTPKYRIDEEERYDYVDLKKCGDDLYCVEYHFTSEQ